MITGNDSAKTSFYGIEIETRGTLHALTTSEKFPARWRPSEKANSLSLKVPRSCLFRTALDEQSVTMVVSIRRWVVLCRCGRALVRSLIYTTRRTCPRLG
ncbi:hypothetical protein EVAR_9559_1 [Eumeta japonica]|uniref:Uncharacterized protein n=1 Tax=Eumeta variegata TaxID=151549 RepID=A0A4C1U565_EUMVA|nr:hypothetical protein EVAR_9559_1 [Eumeta japonica]